MPDFGSLHKQPRNSLDDGLADLRDFGAEISNLLVFIYLAIVCEPEAHAVPLRHKDARLGFVGHCAPLEVSLDLSDRLVGGLKPCVFPFLSQVEDSGYYELRNNFVRLSACD